MQAKAQLAQQAALLRAGQLIEAEDASKVVAHYLTVWGNDCSSCRTGFESTLGETTIISRWPNGWKTRFTARSKK